MTTREPFQTSADEEVTLVAPRFNDEETVVARRVVPLGQVGQVAPPAAAQNSAPARAPLPPTRRGRWPLAAALVLISALAGSVLGGVGLYFYLSRASADAPRPADADAGATRPAQADQPAQQAPQPAPTVETADTSDVSTDRQPDSPAAEPKPEDKPAADEKLEDRAGAGEPEKNRGAGARDDSGDEAQAAARKHGKKGANDEDSRVFRRRTDSDREAPLNDDDEATFGGDLRGEVRGGDDDSIFSRPRRAWRHRHDHNRRHEVNSIRGIFEGQP